MRDCISEYNKRGTPVAGVIIEPIQGEGGDNHASPEFFRGLQQICREVCLRSQFLSSFIKYDTQHARIWKKTDVELGSTWHCIVIKIMCKQ